MKALVFRYHFRRLAFTMVAGKLSQSAYLGPLGPTRLEEIPEPELPGEDWCLLRNRLTGICGSDTKQIYLDAAFDNPLSTLVSFPCVLGHEVVGVVERVGPAVKERRAGERVVLNPWLGCVPRGIDPPCPACQEGLYFNCQHFDEGRLPAGMHIGNNRAVSGGFAPRMAAHESQLFPIPDEVTDEQAVLADPFSVSLHAILKAPPPPGSLAAVYGCGTLGILSIAALRALYPSARIVAITRHPRQEQIARELGAEAVIRARAPKEVITAIGKLTGNRVLVPQYGKPWLLGGVDVIYDTVGSPETLEVGLRIVKTRASIVVTGVARPGRYEWTPHYFKEVALIGSNAFGLEDFEGRRLHAMQIFLQLLVEGRLKLPPMITHRFPLEQYRQALEVSHHKDRHQAIKVVFDFGNS